MLKGHQLQFFLIERSTSSNVIYDRLALLFQENIPILNQFCDVLLIKIDKIFRGKYLRKKTCLSSKHSVVASKLKNSIYFVGCTPNKMNQMKCVYVNINCLKSSCKFQGLRRTELIMTSKTYYLRFLYCIYSSKLLRVVIF